MPRRAKISGSQIGSVIGYAAYGPWGALVGGLVGGALFPTTTEGPRLDDLKPQSSEEGRPLTILAGGTAAIQGNVIYISDLREVARDLGGKGGGEQVLYEYYVDMAVAICEGDADKLMGHVYAGPEKRPIWDGARAENDATITFYNGAEDQLPDPIMEAALGIGNVPAYRGTAYVMLSNFLVTKDGNRPPILTVEIGNIDANIAPENLGQINIQQVIVGEDFYAAFYNGSYYGIIIRSLADDSLIKHYTFDAGDWSLGNDTFWDADNQVFVRPNRNTLTYTTIAYANGQVTNHTITAAAGADSNPGNQVRGGAYHNNTYIFAAANSTGVANRVTLYGMDPELHTPVFTYCQNTAAGEFQGPLLKPIDSASYVYGYSAPARLSRFPLSSGATPTDMGAPVPGTLSAMEVDPNTGYVWSVAAGSAGYIEVRVSDPVAATQVYSGTIAAPMSLNSTPFTFIPTMFGLPNRAVISGEQYIGIDNFIEFDADIPDLIEYTVGGYHGTVLINAMIYNPSTTALMAFRSNGYVTYGTYDDPASVNFLISPTFNPELDNKYLGTADATLRPQGQPLSEVVLGLHLRSGLTADQVDVTALADDIVDGYAIPSPTSIRDAITVLMRAYYFDAVESEGKIKYVKRGGAAITIPDADVGCFEFGSETDGGDMETVRRMEDELPRVMNVRYILAATNYSPGAKAARRQIGSSGDEQSLDLPLVLTDTKGQEIAEVNLHGAWIARITYSFTLTRKWAHLEPTDVVVVNGYTMRITRIVDDDGIRKCDAVAEDAPLYTPHVLVQETPPIGGDVPAPPTSDQVSLALMDIAMLRDADDDAGIYAAASEPCVIYMSRDGGASYTQVATITNAATIGVTTTALGNFTGGNVRDERSSVTVALANGTLSSTTNAGLLENVNLSVIGGEVLPFRDAALTGASTYKLTGFLRGRRGTEWAISTHSVGEQFVLASTATLVRVPQSTSDIGQERLYKAVPSGGTLTGTTAVAFTNYAAGLECYSPVHLGGGFEANGDATLKFKRRTRVSGELRDYVEVPLGEDIELYEVDICSDSTYATVLRTLSGLTSQTATYTSAQQTTDFGGAQTTVYFVAYQISATVGRGYPGYGYVKASGTAPTTAPPAPAPAPAPGPAPAPAPATPPGSIAVDSYPNATLQSSTSSGGVAYWVGDGVWNPGALTRGTYTGLAGTQYEQYTGVSPSLGPNGEIACRLAWGWPTGDLETISEIKTYPSIIFGEKPGWENVGPSPGGIPILLPDGTYSSTAPSGPTPGTFLPRQLPLDPLYSSFAWEHQFTPTGRGHLSWDIWLKSNPDQTSSFGTYLTHEIMIPLTYWGSYGAYPFRNPGWYSHDVTLEGYLWHVYYAPDFNGVWKFIVFEPNSANAISPGTLNLATFINYVRLQGWAPGDLWCPSVELGVEVVDGEGDLVISNFRVY